MDSIDELFNNPCSVSSSGMYRSLGHKSVLNGYDSAEELATKLSPEQSGHGYDEATIAQEDTHAQTRPHFES